MKLVSRPLHVLLLGSLATLVHAETFVVDDDGGPGVDFTDLPPAIAAAVNGDLLLVREGTYSGFSVVAKRVAIVAQPGADVEIVGSITVEQTLALQEVLLRGLRVEQPGGAGASILDCQGIVWIEDCLFRAANGDALSADGYAGVEAIDSGRVVLQRTWAYGGHGQSYIPIPFFQPHGAGGDGLRAEGTTVAVAGGHYQGGIGGSVADDDAAWSGGRGGHGIWLDGFPNTNFGMVSGPVLVGGAGGVGGSDHDPFIGFSCGIGGEGGSCIDIESSTAWVALGPTSPGPGGPGFEGCPSGETGQEVGEGIGSTVTHFDGGTAIVELDSTIGEGTPIGVALSGPGDRPAFVAFGLFSGFFPFESYAGPALVDLFGPVVLLPTFLPSSGTVSFSVPQSLPVEPGEALRLVAQVAHIDIVEGTAIAGGASSAYILDGSE